MKFHRIWGVLLRYLYLFKRNLDRQSDAFYWPAVDLILWGITSVHFSRQGPDPDLAVLTVVSGIVLWIMVWRGQYEVTVNTLEDLWNKNLVNMFVSPLRFSEWGVSFVILSILKSIPSLLFAALLAWVMYSVNVFRHGFLLLPFLFLLLWTGWWVGFFVAGLIMRFGTKVQQFAWSMAFVIAPFSAIYYPLAALPEWAQAVAKFVPSSYLFEGARQVISQGVINWGLLGMGLLLNGIYLLLCLWFFRRSFDKVLDRGLVKLF